MDEQQKQEQDLQALGDMVVRTYHICGQPFPDNNNDFVDTVWELFHDPMLNAHYQNILITRADAYRILIDEEYARNTPK